MWFKEVASLELVVVEERFNWLRIVWARVHSFSAKAW